MKARRLGEIAVGSDYQLPTTNYQITQYTKNTLFDEKIDRTFHAVVGSGYPETHNQNTFSLH